MTATSRKLEQTRQLARAWYAAGRTRDFVCPRCKGGVLDPDQCNAPLASRCPGFEAMETAHAEFEPIWQARQQ